MQILSTSGSFATAPVTAPTSLSSVPSTTSVAISFTAPTDDGGAPITNYEYSFNLSSWTALSPADATSPVTVSGLTANTSYTVYLRAVNEVGSGVASTGLSFTTAQLAPSSIEYLVIAGGGGGGNGAPGTSDEAGGGGAGGYRTSVSGATSGGGADDCNEYYPTWMGCVVVVDNPTTTLFFGYIIFFMTGYAVIAFFRRKK